MIQVFTAGGTIDKIYFDGASEDVPDKVMVLTGSFAPARFAASDAAFNVGMAFAAVQLLNPGVYIAMNGQIFDALRVRKDRSQMRFVPL